MMEYIVIFLTVFTFFYKFCYNLPEFGIFSLEFTFHFTRSFRIMTTVVIPEATRKRMLLLLNLLGVWPKDKITSVDISEQTGWKDSLIRHDLWLLGYNKGVSNGYQT
ncbi:MAG: hypothetical protein J5710_10650, partial [Treponema sp.]|nr:hypothetical protein [Treponema sp.]